MCILLLINTDQFLKFSSYRCHFILMLGWHVMMAQYTILKITNFEYFFLVLINSLRKIWACKYGKEIIFRGNIVKCRKRLLPVFQFISNVWLCFRYLLFIIFRLKEQPFFFFLHCLAALLNLVYLKSSRLRSSCVPMITFIRYYNAYSFIWRLFICFVDRAWRWFKVSSRNTLL